MDKRAKTRFKYEYNIMCFKKLTKENIESNNIAIRVQVYDISYGGMGIICNMPLEKEDTIIINMSYKTGEKLELNCEVRWTSYYYGKYKAGLAFKELNKEKVIFIHNLIKKEAVV